MHDCSIERVHALSSLTHLSISGTNLSRQDCGRIRFPEGLLSLDMNGCQLSPVFKHLILPPRLERLDISSNFLLMDSVCWDCLSCLRYLDISNNCLSNDEVSEIKQRLPNTTVVADNMMPTMYASFVFTD